MGEDQILTLLIVFALCLNVLGFVFFVKSLKEEEIRVPLPEKYEKDYDLEMNEPYLHEQEPPNGYATYEDDYERYRQPYDEKKPTKPMRYEDDEPTYRKTQHIETIREEKYTPDPLPYEEEPYEAPIAKSYQPTYEEETKTMRETKEKQRPSYEPSYMTEDEMNDYAFPFEKEEPKEDPTPVLPSYETNIAKEVNYQDELRQSEEEIDDLPPLDGEYQFKHAYTTEERYKYEYDDYKGFKPKDQEEEEDDFDDSIDVDKEHEKYYGKKPTTGTARYELYLSKDEEEDDELLAKVKNRSYQNTSVGRQMYQTVDLEHVPETPLDREERKAEETINIKQFEPKKYEHQDMLMENEKKSPDEFDENEVERRIEYLMGKMHDPFKQKEKKNGKVDPLDEEF